MEVNVYEAKTNMSKLMHLLESGEEKEIIICNRGTPTIRWTLIDSPKKEMRPFGIWKDRYSNTSREDFFSLDEEIAGEFEGV